MQLQPAGHSKTSSAAESNHLMAGADRWTGKVNGENHATPLGGRDKLMT